MSRRQSCDPAGRASASGPNAASGRGRRSGARASSEGGASTLADANGEVSIPADPAESIMAALADGREPLMRPPGGVAQTWQRTPASSFDGVQAGNDGESSAFMFIEREQLA